MLKKSILVFLKNNLSLIVLLFLGTISWSLTMVKSGLVYSFGLGFWGANGHDGIWHLALINSLAKSSLEVPVFAGEVLKNYHIGFDLILALIYKLTKISPLNLYFQVVPPILALLVGLLTYWFTLSWTKSKRKAFWATFFTYFGGSFAWIIGRGESTFWSQQAISTLVNPPFALSLIFILLGLILLLKNKKIFSIICFGLLIQIKAYAGILVLGALFISGIFSLIINRKSYILYLFFGSLVLSLLLFLPFNRGSVPMLVWQPFWFLETMMGLTDRLGWLKFHSAMTNYRMGGIWIKAIPAYIAAFLIFLLGNMGTRIIFLFRKIGKITEIDIFIYSVIIAGILIPMFFLQKGTPWNTIQFFYYSLLFSGILAGITLSRTTFYILLATVLLTLPTTYFTLRDVYFPSRPPAMVSHEELEALDFLSKEPDGVVLTYPFDKYKSKEAESNPPRPLYLYVSSAYVSAFSNKAVFLEDEVNLDITGYDWKSRREEVLWFVSTVDQKEAREFLEKNKIKYLYLVKFLSPLPGEKLRLGEEQLGLKKIFENKEVDIYKVLN